jgi:hypothetical protein
MSRGTTESVIRESLAGERPRKASDLFTITKGTFLAACRACRHSLQDAGIQKPDWMPDQVRHDAEYPAAFAAG